MANKRDDIKMVFFSTGDREYEIEDLMSSSDAKVLGKGTFGTTYQATLELKDKNKTVAVKRLNMGRLPEIEFGKKIEKIGKMVHENLSSIRDDYYSQKEALLVYNYMHMGSLASLLHGKEVTRKCSLTWEVRNSIAYQVAHGIAYIHTRGSNVCHGNLRSSNVLLTESLIARVSDFCIYQHCPEKTKPSQIEGYYCAPEVPNIHEVSQKSDVYSFGVLLLELLTGKVPLHVVGTTEVYDLAKWVREMFQEKPILAVFDDMLLKFDKNEEQMVHMLELAVCCTFRNPSKRPSMAAVTNRIKHIVDNTMIADFSYG